VYQASPSAQITFVNDPMTSTLSSFSGNFKSAGVGARVVLFAIGSNAVQINGDLSA
jgi:hypothetical protein